MAQDQSTAKAFTWAADDASQQKPTSGFTWDSDKDAPPQSHPPTADQSAALKRVAQPTEFETMRTGNPFERTLAYAKGEGRALKNAAEGTAQQVADFGEAASGTNPAAAVRSGKDIVGTPSALYEQGKAIVTHPIETAQDPEQFTNDVVTGASFAAPYAKGVMPAEGTLADRAISAPGAMREKVAAAIRTPEGELKPGVRTASRVVGGVAGGAAGGVAGHAIGIPGLGEVGPEYLGYKAGAAAGPAMLEKLFPGPKVPASQANPFRLTPDEPVGEEPVQTTIEFPKPTPPKAATNPNPFRLTPDETMSEPAVQTQMQFPVARPTPPPAVRLPEPELPKGPNRMATQEIAQRVDEATGNTPVVKGVPLREQPRMTPANPATPAETTPKTLAEKYPDKPTRQWVHTNGEMMYNATKNDPEAMKGIHAMTRVDLRQALINSGEDMGDKVVSDSKFAGEGAIPRQTAFERLLAKGYTPKQIVELGKKPIGPHGTVIPPAAREPELVHR